MMLKMLKATALSVGLVAVSVWAAQAQSVSSVPPAGPTTSTVAAQPYVSTQRIVPDPGGSVSIKDTPAHSSANATSALIDHPYSGAEDNKASGPKAN